MHLKRIKITEFRNLKDFEISFNIGDELLSEIAITGYNGTGKSNLFEAIVIIFRDLDLKQTASFSYELEYDIDNHIVVINAIANSLPNVIVDGKKEDLYKPYLPNQLYYYFSERNNRVIGIFHDYFDKKDKSSRRKLFLCHQGYSRFVFLICLLIQDDVFNSTIKKISNVELDSALIKFKYLKFIDNHDDLSSEYFIRNMMHYGRFIGPDQFEIKRDQFLDLVVNHIGGINELFMYLNRLYKRDVIEDIQINVKSNNINMRVEDLSEGETQLLTLLTLVYLSNLQQCLVLLDHPDIFLHPELRLRFFDILEKINQRKSSQVIVNTHDPLTLAPLLREQVRILRNDDNRILVHEPKENPQGLRVSEILTSDIFGFRTNLDLDTQDKLDRKYHLMAVSKKRKLKDTEVTELEKLSNILLYRGFSDCYNDHRIANELKQLRKRVVKLEAQLTLDTPVVAAAEAYWDTTPMQTGKYLPEYISVDECFRLNEIEAEHQEKLFEEIRARSKAMVEAEKDVK